VVPEMTAHRFRRRCRVKFFLLVLVLNLAYVLKYTMSNEIDLLPYQKGDATNATFKQPMLDFSSVINQPMIFGRGSNSSFGALHPFPNRRIDHVRILGERHSGTTYLTRYLQTCFSDHQIMDLMVRTKHWFQPSPEAIVTAASIVDEENLADATGVITLVPGHKSWWDMAHSPDIRRLFSNSFILYIVRDPYQWMEAMRRQPWHWPNHLRIIPRNQTTISATIYDSEKQIGKRRALRTDAGVPKGHVKGDYNGPVRVQKSYVGYETLDWDTFVQAPLRLMEEDAAANHSAKICMKGFPKGTVSPCLRNHSFVPPLVSHIPRSFLRHLPFAVNDAVYELKADGKEFDDPLALRAAKIRNILGLADVWDFGGFAVVRYEDVLNANDNGVHLKTLVEEIESLLGVSNHCQTHQMVNKTAYILPNEFMKWIGQHADWDIERRIGYSPATGPG